MTPLLARKLARDLVLRPWRTLLAVLAMAVALAGCGTVLVTWFVVRAATETGFRASLPVSATLRLDAVDAAMLDAVRAVPGVVAARMRRTVRASARVGDAWRAALLHAHADYAATDIARLAPDGGAWPPAPGELVVERSSLEFADTAIGRSIELAYAGRDAVALPVTGIVRDVSQAPGWMENVVYLYVDAATLARLGAPAGYDELQIRVADGNADRDAVRRIAARVAARVRELGGEVRAVDVPPPGEHVHAAQMNSLLMTQGAFAALALLAGAFLTFNLVSAVLAGEVRQVGVLKTLGARPREVATLYLSFAAALGALACVLALPFSAWAGWRYAGLKAELLNFTLAGVALPWPALALLALAGIAVPVAAALLPVRHAARTPIATALGDAAVEPSRAWRVPGRSLLARPKRWALDNAFRRPRRAALTVLALALGGAVYIGAANLRNAVIGSVDLLFSSLRYDVALAWRDGPAPAQAERIARDVEGVDAAEAWLRVPATPIQADGLAGDALPLLGVPVDGALFAPRLLEGRFVGGGTTREIVVGRGFVRDVPEARVGTRVSLAVEGRASEWTVVGIVDGPPQPTAYASRAALAAAHGDAAATMLVVRTARRDAAGQLDAVQRLREAFLDAGHPVARSQRPDENRRAVEDHLLMVVDFLGAMGWIMILVGGMGVASTMGLSVLERTRELGVLRALGARHGAVLGLVQLEGAVLGGSAALLAVPLSLPASRALADAFGRVMFTLPPIGAPEPEAVLRWFVLALGVASLASLAPAWRATRVPVARALAHL